MKNELGILRACNDWVVQLVLELPEISNISFNVFSLKFRRKEMYAWNQVKKEAFCKYPTPSDVVTLPEVFSVTTPGPYS